MKIKSKERKTILLKESGIFEVEDDTCLTCVVVLLGSDKEMEVQINLGEHSICKFICFFVGAGDDDMKLSVTLVHSKSHSVGEILVKGVLTGSAKCSVKGLIKMDKHIRVSSGFFSQRTLLLSEKALVKSLPHLEIASCNVQVKHEVAISYLDKEQLFYLMSRGIKEKEASKLIVEGLFSKEQKLLNSDLQKKLTARLQSVI